MSQADYDAAWLDYHQQVSTALASGLPAAEVHALADRLWRAMLDTVGEYVLVSWITGKVKELPRYEK